MVVSESQERYIPKSGGDFKAVPIKLTLFGKLYGSIYRSLTRSFESLKSAVTQLDFRVYGNYGFVKRSTGQLDVEFFWIDNDGDEIKIASDTDWEAFFAMSTLTGKPMEVFVISGFNRQANQLSLEDCLHITGINRKLSQKKVDAFARAANGTNRKRKFESGFVKASSLISISTGAETRDEVNESADLESVESKQPELEKADEAVVVVVPKSPALVSQAPLYKFKTNENAEVEADEPASESPKNVEKKNDKTRASLPPKSPAFVPEAPLRQLKSLENGKCSPPEMEKPNLPKIIPRVEVIKRPVEVVKKDVEVIPTTPPLVEIIPKPGVVNKPKPDPLFIEKTPTPTDTLNSTTSSEQSNYYPRKTPTPPSANISKSMLYGSIVTAGPVTREIINGKKVDEKHRFQSPVILKPVTNTEEPIPSITKKSPLPLHLQAQATPFNDDEWED